MSSPGSPHLSAHALRRELNARNLVRASEGLAHEQSSSELPSVLYAPDDAGNHGNFLPASYRRILADPAWRERLAKAYTASALIPRRHDRRRSELDCAASSDALLMNVFCYPGMMRRPAMCGLLGIEPGQRPEFGFRPMLPMLRGEIDRTEVDMRLGPLLVEAKLTEGGFGTASEERFLRYRDVDTCFDVDSLPRGGKGVLAWQLIRGVLAAAHCEARFVVLCDGRRPDLREAWFRVLGAVRGSELRSRLGLVTWQEVADAAPTAVRHFLAAKYGILGR